MDNFFYKTWHSFFLLAFILLLFVGCSRKPVKYTIAVSQCSEDIWRDKLNEELKTTAYIYDNVELLFSTTPAIERAYKKGIPVVLFDRKTESAHYTAFMGADNYQIALRRHPGVRLVDSQAGDWSEQSGVRAMERILSRNGEIDCVFGQNDRMALGARKVLMSRLPGSKTKFVGIDALATPGGGIREVKDGHLDASYIYPTRGDKLLQLAMNILEHNPYKKENLLEAAIVTPDNAEVMLMQADEMSKQNDLLKELHSHVDRFLGPATTIRRCFSFWSSSFSRFSLVCSFCSIVDSCSGAAWLRRRSVPNCGSSPT